MDPGLRAVKGVGDGHESFGNAAGSSDGRPSRGILRTNTDFTERAEQDLVSDSSDEIEGERHRPNVPGMKREAGPAVVDGGDAIPGSGHFPRLPALFSAVSLQVPLDKFGQSLNLRREFVLQPIPYPDRSRALRARIIRVKSGMTGKLFPTYHLCISNAEGDQETIVLAAQRLTAKRSMRSYYVLAPRTDGSSLQIRRFYSPISGR